MNNQYIIAHTWRDIEMTIEVFYSNHKALKYISEMTNTENFRKPDVDENVKEFLADFYDFVADELDNQCEHTIALKLITNK